MSGERVALEFGEVHGAIEPVRPQLSTKTKRLLQTKLNLGHVYDPLMALRCLDWDRCAPHPSDGYPQARIFFHVTKLKL